MQDDAPRPTSRSWLVSAAATVVAGGIGYVWNSYPVIVGDGLWIVYGSIPALLVAMLFGPWAGLIAGFLAGVATVTTWGQSVGLALYTTEAIVIGWASRRAVPTFRNAFIADAMFWAIVGIPAVAVYGLIVRHFGPTVTWLVIVKYVANATLYMAVALLLAHSAIARWIAPGQATEPVPLDATLFRAVALSAMLPFLVAQTFFAQIARRGDLEDGRRLLVATSRGVAGALDGFFEASLRTTRTLEIAIATFPDRTPARLAALLDSTRAVGGDDIAAVFALDATGRYIAGSPSSSAVTPGASLADRDYYVGAVRTRAPYVSSGFASRTSTGSFAALAVPIVPPSGAVVGVVVSSVDLRRLDRIVQPPSAAHEVLVTDARGRVVVSPDTQLFPLLAQRPASLQPLANDSAVGTAEFAGKNRVIAARTGLYASAETRSGWRVYTMVPNLAIYARSSSQNMLILANAVALMMVLLGLMRVLSRQLTRPLGLLAAQASDMRWDGAGRLGAALPSAMPSAPSEVVVVAQAFALADERIRRAAREAWDALAMRDTAIEERDQSLRTLEARVRERTEDLQAALARVEAASMAKSAFLANMSHELRTPLNAILGNAEILEEGLYGPLTPRQVELVKTVDSSGRHLLALIQDILDISRIESGRLALEIGDVDLDEVIRHVVTTLTARATTAHLDVRVEIPSRVRPVRADHLRLTQVFDNLVTNAIKFTDAGGRVTVSVIADPDGTVREALVRDTGIGIPEAMQARVFEPFEQGSVPLRRAQGGSGLGLAIVRSLCAAMNLTLSLESAPGTGTTLRIGFPPESGEVAAAPAADGKSASDVG